MMIEEGYEDTTPVEANTSEATTSDAKAGAAARAAAEEEEEETPATEAEAAAPSRLRARPNPASPAAQAATGQTTCHRLSPVLLECAAFARVAIAASPKGTAERAATAAAAEAGGGGAW